MEKRNMESVLWNKWPNIRWKKELIEHICEMQECILNHLVENFIEFPEMFMPIQMFLDNEEDNEQQMLFLYGSEGVGKSSYLAKWIKKYRESYNIMFRFCGYDFYTTQESPLLFGLYEEMRIRQETDECKEMVIVLDAIEHLDISSMNWYWMNPLLYFAETYHVKWIISCCTGTEHFEKMKEYYTPIRCKIFSLEQQKNKNKVIESVLKTYRVVLDKNQHQLIFTNQSENLLFYKYVLKICYFLDNKRKDYFLKELQGKDISYVTRELLKLMEISYMEQNQNIIRIKPAALLGLLAYSHVGLDVRLIIKAYQYLDIKADELSISNILFYYASHFEDFLCIINNYVTLKHESFRNICRKRYSGFYPYHQALAWAYSQIYRGMSDEYRNKGFYYTEWLYHIIKSGKNESVWKVLLNDIFITAILLSCQGEYLSVLLGELTKEQIYKEYLLKLQKLGTEIQRRPEMLKTYLSNSLEKESLARYTGNMQQESLWVEYQHTLWLNEFESSIWSQEFYGMDSQVEPCIHIYGKFVVIYGCTKTSHMYVLHIDSGKPALVSDGGYYWEGVDIVTENMEGGIRFYSLDYKKTGFLLNRWYLEGFKKTDILDYWPDKSSLYAWKRDSKQTITLYKWEAGWKGQGESLSLWNCQKLIKLEGEYDKSVVVFNKCNNWRGVLNLSVQGDLYNRLYLYRYDIPFIIWQRSEKCIDMKWLNQNLFYIKLDGDEKRTEFYDKDGRLVLTIMGFADISSVANGMFYFTLNEKQQQSIFVELRWKDNKRYQLQNKKTIYQCNWMHKDSCPVKIKEYGSDMVRYAIWEDILVLERRQKLEIFKLEKPEMRILEIPLFKSSELMDSKCQLWELNDNYIYLITCILEGERKGFKISCLDLRRFFASIKEELKRTGEALLVLPHKKGELFVTKTHISYEGPDEFYSSNVDIIVEKAMISDLDNVVLYNKNQVIVYGLCDGKPVSKAIQFHDNETVLLTLVKGSKLWIITCMNRKNYVYLFHLSGKMLNKYRLKLSDGTVLNSFGGKECLWIIYQSVEGLVCTVLEAGEGITQKINDSNDTGIWMSCLLEGYNWLIIKNCEERIIIYAYQMRKLKKIYDGKELKVEGIIHACWKNYVLLQRCGQGILFDIILQKIVVMFPLPWGIEEIIVYGDSLYIRCGWTPRMLVLKIKTPTGFKEGQWQNDLHKAMSELEENGQKALLSVITKIHSTISGLENQKKKNNKQSVGEAVINDYCKDEKGDYVNGEHISISGDFKEFIKSRVDFYQKKNKLYTLELRGLDALKLLDQADSLMKYGYISNAKAYYNMAKALMPIDDYICFRAEKGIDSADKHQ